MGKVAILIALAACGLSVNAHAQNLLAYWNMDASTASSKFTANAGSQAGSVIMTAEPEGFLSYLKNTDGTTVNLYGPAGDPNNALRTASFVSVFTEGYVVMSDLNTTGMTDLTISFAIRSDAFITWNEQAHIDYRLNDGSWVDWTEVATTSTGAWELESFVLPDAVENQTNVDLRIRMTAFFSVDQNVDFDNIQITAVPEPGTWALLGGLGIAGLVIIRRRRA
jgi:hypothetical protein